jgi:hypothetical protein
VALVRADVSEESITFIISMKRISEPGTALAVTMNLITHTVFLRSVPLLLVPANVFPSSLIFHPNDGDDTFLRNVGSCKGHTTSQPIIRILHACCSVQPSASFEHLHRGFEFDFRSRYVF